MNSQSSCLSLSSQHWFFLSCEVRVPSSWEHSLPHLLETLSPWTWSEEAGNQQGPLPPATPHLSPLTDLEFQLLPWMLGFELRSSGLLSKSSHPLSDSPVSSFPLSPQVSFIHQNLPGVVSWNVACQNVPDFLNLKAAHILVNDYENVTGLLVCNLSRWGHLLTALWLR